MHDDGHNTSSTVVSMNQPSPSSSFPSWPDHSRQDAAVAGETEGLGADGR